MRQKTCCNCAIKKEIKNSDVANVIYKVAIMRNKITITKKKSQQIRGSNYEFEI